MVTSNLKNAILQMTATLENSDTKLHFNYAENLEDGRGITFGCIGFCTGTYDGNILIKHYTELNPDNILAKYIPSLDKIDSAPHNSADGDGNSSTEGLSGFIQDVNSCDDPLFKKAQIDKLDELYYNPAMEIADLIGAKNALTKAFIYDMCVRHGVDGAENIIKEAGTISNDENIFLLKLISLRDAELKREGLGDVDRNQGYKNVLNRGNVELKTPFTFVAYGDEFTIDGILDLGENEQETTDVIKDVSIITENRMKEAAPTTVFKNPDFLDIGGMNGKRYRDLIQLDLSEYTKDSNISKVLLSFNWYYPANTRAKDTIIEVYRPASAWNPDYVSWNNKNKSVAWTKAGGDWYDKNVVLQGSTPYATLTIKGSVVPNSKYYDLDITDLVKEYVSGKYENTGLLLKAKAESDNYIAFYSSKSESKPILTVTLEPVIEDPVIVDPPVVVEPEDPTPVETPAYIMILCTSSTDANNLSEDLKTHIGDREIKIFNQA